jgi:hypothetical protein
MRLVTIKINVYCKDDVDFDSPKGQELVEQMETLEDLLEGAARSFVEERCAPKHKVFVTKGVG